MALITTIIAIVSISFAVIHFKKKRHSMLVYEKVQALLRPVQESLKSLNDAQRQYSVLRSDYARVKSNLNEELNIIDQHNVGLGTFDKSPFKRVTDPLLLPKLEADLKETESKIKAMVSNKTACICSLGDLAVNGNRQKGKTFINREIRLRLRCFDNAVMEAIAIADWNNINRLTERLRRIFKDINSRGEIVKIKLRSDYLELRIKELKLSYEISQLKADIKEEEREERRRQREAEREEARIKAAAEEAKQDRERMEKLVEEELAKFETSNDEQRELLELHKRELELLKQRETRAVSMAQLTRAGYVYVISNSMFFDEGVVKIGMSRRADPYERIRELGDASVPDTFDVHALYYSGDAPAFEKALHTHFANEQVNLVNNRKEFFYVSPQQVVETVTNMKSEHQFQEVPL